MKQLLFLLLFPCLCVAQYTGNAGQKITLGEQTSADGLVFRGVANIDTVTATSKITRTNKQDTSAYILLDTVTNLLWHYKIGSNGWIQAGGSTLDTATMLLPYYRAGRSNIIQAADVPTLNQNTTGSAATLTTGRTIQTNLASTSAATFNGSANITPGVTGTLRVANGGTNLSTLTANSILYGSSSTQVATSSNLNFITSGLQIGNENEEYNNIQILNKNTTPNTNRRGGIGSKTFENDSLVGIVSIFAGIDSRVLTFGGGVTNLKNPTGIRFMTSLNTVNPSLRGDLTRMQIDSIGNIGINTTTPNEKLHVVGNARITGAYSVTTGSAANVFVTTDGVLQRSTSSIKYKTDVEDYSKGLKEVMQLRPVTFKSINSNNDKTYAGFIAEELADLKLNELVENNDSGEPDAISYAYMVTLLTKAIQEQQEQISLLKKRLLILENK